MAVWLVRCGRFGEREQINVDRSIVSIGWDLVPDLTSLSDRADLTAIMTGLYPDKKPSAIANWVGQVWAFAKTIAVGDLVAMPLKTSPAIQFGRVTGAYRYSTDLMLGAEHNHPVEWLRTVPRTSIDPDLLYSLGAIMTVCRIERNDAESRLKHLLTLPDATISASPQSAPSDPTDETTTVDLEEVLRDGIRTRIAQKFDGHALAELVESILKAQGYKTFLSPPGADGGVDVLAGLGSHGFDGPKVAVQVKSGGIEVDTTILRLFKTAMHEFGADRGLIVSWGGFKQPVKREVARQFFNIRMWGEDDLIDAILENYELLPATMQAKLPLKKTWMLISDD